MIRLVLCLLFMSVSAPDALAVWAYHGIFSPVPQENVHPWFEEVRAEYGISVEPIEGEGVKVTITCHPDELRADKGYFLVTCRERLPEDGLNLRTVMGTYKMWNDNLQAQLQSLEELQAALAPDHPQREFILRETEERILQQKNEMPASFANIESIYELCPFEREDSVFVELILTREQAMRTYVVMDDRGIFYEGMFLFDGGLWLTYDIPAYVEVLSKDS